MAQSPSAFWGSDWGSKVVEHEALSEAPRPLGLRSALDFDQPIIGWHEHGPKLGIRHRPLQMQGRDVNIQQRRRGEESGEAGSGDGANQPDTRPATHPPVCDRVLRGTQARPGAGIAYEIVERGTGRIIMSVTPKVLHSLHVAGWIEALPHRTLERGAREWAYRVTERGIAAANA